MFYSLLDGPAHLNRQSRAPLAGAHFSTLGKFGSHTGVTYGFSDDFALCPQAHANIETDFGENASLACGQGMILDI
ncbi:hypothetical protein [uncultured Tateyamaria sp.]|uniref:hypothetical protein n=1 Tax=uncultured Tateyamaria sp. TaxID=455651 RepID=UPI002616634B|nr:hypothetical protein [uncultured Tateyamaria sp.]